MGVDKGCRGQGLGQLICDFCIGLAITISEQIACRYLILETSQDKVSYYNKKCGFKQSTRTNRNGRIWMYRRLIREAARVINEKVGINESVAAVLAKADNE
jgi:hypothetical protein